MSIYENCPVLHTDTFTIRLVTQKDSTALFSCYHDRQAVALMNEDNCDFGFYVDSQEQMDQTVAYWLDFYRKQCFVRFAVVDAKNGKAAGTLEGFGGETGVLRIDLASDYEKCAYLRELLVFAKEHFGMFFGNTYLVTKAISDAAERRRALELEGWEFIDSFREYHDYYKIAL